MPSAFPCIVHRERHQEGRRARDTPPRHCALVWSIIRQPRRDVPLHRDLPSRIIAPNALFSTATCFATILLALSLTRPYDYSLYRAPVESDIKSKLPKDAPTRARSTIRRTRHNINDSTSRPSSTSLQYYARRVGLDPRARARILSPPTADSQLMPWDYIDPAEADTTSRSATQRPGQTNFFADLSRDNATQDGSRRREPVLREVITRNGPMSQEVVRYFGEHMARLYAGTSSRGTQDSEATPEGDSQERSSSSLDDVLPTLERFESQVSDFRTSPHVHMASYHPLRR